MRTATLIEPLFDAPPRATPALRLDFGRFWARSLVFVFATTEFLVVARILRIGAGVRTGLKLAWIARITPMVLAWSALIALAAAVAATLLVRLAFRPLLARWFDPRPADASVGDHAPFRLASSERVESEVPARLRTGRRAEPGTLAITDRKLWFFPASWDAEAQSIELDRVDHIRLVPSRLARLRNVRGWPDELVVCEDDGIERRLAVADPRVVLDWFEDSAVPRYLHRP